MYHTLLPQKERRAIRREYRIRALIVFLFIVSVAGTIGVVSLFPAYVRSTLDAKTAAKELEAAKSESSPELSAIQDQVSVGQILLTKLQSEFKSQRLSIWAENVVNNRGTVRINALNVNMVSTSSISILVKGIAPTRDSLLGFKQTIEDQIPGSKSDLPLSELAKGTNIEFSLDFNAPIQ